MSLQGDFKTLTFPMLLQSLAARRVTGTLTIFHGNLQHDVFISEGRLLFVLSNDPRDYLGHFLVSKGLIDESVMAKAFKEHLQTLEHMGQIMRRLSQISEDVINTQLTEKLKESFFQLFLLEDARFGFVATEGEKSKFPFMTSLALRPFIAQGVRRLRRYRQLREIFPDSKQTFRVKRENLSRDVERESGSKTQLQNVLTLLEKGSNIEALGLHLHAHEDNILQYLFRLYDAGVVELQPVTPVYELQAEEEIKNDPVEIMFRMAQDAYLEKNFVKAALIFADVLQLHPGYDMARNCLKEVEGQIRRDLEQGDSSYDGILKLNPNVNYATIHLSALDGFVLSRIDGKMDISEIVSVVPMPVYEVLASIHRLLDAQIIKIVSVLDTL